MGSTVIRGRPRPDPLAPPTPAVVRRFLAKVVPDPTSECLLWTGATNHKGYGTFRVRSRKEAKRTRQREVVKAHRYAVFLFRGIDLGDLDGDHECRRRDCVNPYHVTGRGLVEHARLSNADKAERLRPAPVTTEDLAIL